MTLVPTSESFESPFDSIRRVTPHGAEYWSARDLQSFLGYTTWENFQTAIERAKAACLTLQVKVENHFRDATKKVAIGSNAERAIADCNLSRFACYLVAQNGDPRKREIAEAQAYFAIQTRRQELADSQNDADAERTVRRQQFSISFKAMSAAAKDAGVIHFGHFSDAGYRSMYGGLGVAEIKSRKRIPTSEDLPDRMPSLELSANNMRMDITKHRLVNEGVKGEVAAVVLHNEVGGQVRDLLIRVANVKPEDIPAERNIKHVIAERRKAQRRMPER